MNLTRFPTITLAKLVLIPYEEQFAASQFYFNYDETIQKSKLKGIRYEQTKDARVNPGATIPPISMSYNVSQIFGTNYLTPALASPLIASYFGITLVDMSNNIILNNYPILGLTNPDTVNPNTNYIRRFNADIDISKSFISLVDKTQSSTIFATYKTWFFNFTFYIKSKN